MKYLHFELIYRRIELRCLYLEMPPYFWIHNSFHEVKELLAVNSVMAQNIGKLNQSSKQRISVSI